MPTSPASTVSLSSEDQVAIETTLRNLLSAFRNRDAAALASVYTDDADWTNAFGTTLSGRDAIISYLTGLFADQHFAAGRLLGEPQVSVRPIHDGVVLVKSYSEVEGQETVEGGKLPVRRNHSLKVLLRERDGAWRITSEIYMDVRDEETYRRG